jgi:hypothetical protein
MIVPHLQVLIEKHELIYQSSSLILNNNYALLPVALPWNKSVTTIVGRTLAACYLLTEIMHCQAVINHGQASST